jgi:thiosulfate/3-mercaptopyruvate sulfurtransferase
MKKVLLIVLVVAGFNATAQKPILVSAEWVKEHLQDPDLVLIQVGFMKYEYDKEHIPGARYLWPSWLAPDTPYGSYNAPDPKAATTLLRSLGVSNKSHVILYHIRNEVSITARMFLTLEYLGLKGQVSFLNGGMDAWKKAGYEVTPNIPVVKKGKFTARPGGQLVDKEYVLKSLQSPQSVVVDARMTRFYDGDPTGNPRDGHITGALNIPYTEMIDQANMFKPAEELQSYFTAAVPDKSKEIVTYCFIGQTASVVYIAGRILGYEMKLYDGSLQEWSRLENLPMEKTKK